MNLKQWLAGACLLLFGGCDLPTKMLYRPGSETLEAVQGIAGKSGLKLWLSDDAAYRGIVGREGPPKAKGTVVVFHGNAGTAVHRSFYVRALQRLGYRVVLAEYPGYGGRGGAISEKELVADGLVTARMAREAFGAPLIVWGESLGCGVAAALAADAGLKPDGVVLVTPWDSLVNEAKALYPWLPVGAFMRDRYESVKNLENYKGPVAVLMAARDKVIPNVLTQNLYDSLTSPKKLWIFENSGHNDWPNYPNAAWWGEVMAFVDANDSNQSQN